MRSHCKLSSGFANTCKGRTAEFQSNFFPLQLIISQLSSMVMSSALIILGELLSVCPALGVSQMFDVNMSVKPALLTHSLPKQGVWGPLAAAVLLSGHRPVRSRFMLELQMTRNILGMVGSEKKLHLLSTQVMLKSE